MTLNKLHLFSRLHQCLKRFICAQKVPWDVARQHIESHCPMILTWDTYATPWHLTQTDLFILFL